MSEELHTLFRLEWETRLNENPEFATYLGDERYNDRLKDVSMEAIERRHVYSEQMLEKLLSIDRSELSQSDQLNHDLFRKELESRLEEYEFLPFLMPVNQMGGLQIDLPNLVHVTKFRHAKDYDDFLSRLAAFPTLVDQTIALMKEGAKEQIVQPAIVLRTVPRQIKAQFDIDVETSPLYLPFAQMSEEMTEAEKKRYKDQGRKAIRDLIFSSYRKFHDFFVNDYLPAARDEIAISEIPNGSEYYDFLVRHHTTTDLSAKEIHEIGVEEVKRIRGEMKKIIGEVNFQGSFDDFIEFLRTDPQFYFTSRDELLAGYRDICKRADPELTKLFGILPRTPYGVMAMPEYQAPAAPTAYYHPPSANGSRAGYFWVNTYLLEVRPKYEMEALALHEAVPGHHLQIALAMELEETPEFRKQGGFTAFVEGWGLYAESLGEKIGFYEDPYSKFGQLTYEMWRACRLVVDTGMHAFGWSRQKAIDFMKKNSAKTEHDIEVEIDRYIAWPGQALAYKIGELKIKELRRVAKESLGTEFDIREFHDVVLRNGALPLDLLEDAVMTYVETRQKN
ncbi:MAG: DUF885 domain-containing protein [Candidatus Neomarinimicrobiota bacterium]